MSAAERPTRSSDWRHLASLGEQLISAASLAVQRERIVAMTSRLVAGEAQIWLHEALLRLPDWDEPPLFPPEPPAGGMRRAFKTGKRYTRSGGSARSPGGACAAIPLVDRGMVLGALQVSRPSGPAFRQEELDLLDGIASIVSVGLISAHRVAVERFHIEQLNLVRGVGAQIAAVLDVDELARRVTGLIQQTFKFYYVAIFTLEPGQPTLRFRASAGRKGRRRASIAPPVALGQGLIGGAAQSGEEVVCDDVRAEPRFRFMDSLPEAQSEIVLPLKIKEQVLGVLDVQSDKRRAFHPTDMLVLRALADNIAAAVEAARLYGDLRRRARQLEVIAAVSRSVASTLDLRALMNQAAALIHERFGYPYVHLFSVHPNRRQIIYEAGSGRRSASLAGYLLSLDDAEGIIPWVARNNQPLLSNDVSREPRYRPDPFPPKNTRSELAVPLVFNERLVGVLDVQSDRINAFTQDDQMIFAALGGNIAAAIHNADLYRSEQWRRQVGDSLHEVAGLLSANVGVEQVLDAVLTELERNLPAEVTAIWLLEEDRLYPAAVHGCDSAALEAAKRDSAETALSLASALLATSPRIRKPTDPLGPAGKAAGFDSNYSSIAAPLRIGDRPLGVLALAHSDPGRYGHEAQSMTATFASYAAAAIENARLYDAAQEQAYASAALLQVAQAVVSLSDLDEILGTIVRAMPILVGVERCAIYLWDAAAESCRPAQAYGIPDEAATVLWKEEVVPGDFPLLEAACRANRMALHALETQAAPEAWPALLPVLGEAAESAALQSDHRLLLAFPLAIKDDLYGAMLVEECGGGRRFRARRLEIVAGIAQQAALAIQNDRLQKEMVGRERLEAEVQLARQIQQSLMPERLPVHPGWELAARWRTARQVGGDFYDVIELPGRRLGLFIADVADKGIPAALFMAVTRSLARDAASEYESPAEALGHINMLLLPDTQQGMFITAVYAVLNLQSGELTYANAGHNPPLWLRRKTGAVERLTRTGMALGVMENFDIGQRVIRLESGDSLLLYTDGLTEAFSPAGDLFEEKRLLDVLAALPPCSAEAMLDAIEKVLNDFLGDLPLADDLTMLAVRRTA